MLIRLRNTSKAFGGELKINDVAENLIDILWSNGNDFAHLKANLITFKFSISYSESGLNYVKHF